MTLDDDCLLHSESPRVTLDLSPPELAVDEFFVGEVAGLRLGEFMIGEECFVGAFRPVDKVASRSFSVLCS